MHCRGLMLLLDALEVHPFASLASALDCALPSVNAQVQHWLTLFIHTQQNFGEKDGNERKFGSVSNRIFIENKPS